MHISTKMNIRTENVLKEILNGVADNKESKGTDMRVSGRIFLCSFVILAAFLLFPGPARSGDDFAAGELLVKFKSGYDGKGAKAIEEIGAKVLEKLSRLDVSRLGLPGGLDVKKAMARLNKLPFVEFAEPNYIFKPTWSPSDPKWNDQWGITKIDTPGGWGMETGDRDVIIAIVDTGVDLDHPDLKNKIVAGYDYVGMDSDPDDVGGHGTHCAGIAAASTNNGIGVAGVCANCSIMPLRVLGAEGGLASDVAKGIVWAADHGANVISLSLGGMFPSSTQEDSIKYAWNKGAIVIAAAGNMGVQDAHYPAYHSTCVAVGSTESNDARSGFSNYGSWVDVAAPGGFIMSTIPDGEYGYKSGTSMATPFVAGLAGLLFSKMGSGASNSAVRAAIEDNCDSVGGAWVTRGRVNVSRALASVKAPVPPSSPPAKAPKTGSGSGGGSPAKSSDGGYSPKSFAMGAGSTLKSPADSLVKSDDAALVMRSTQSGKQRHMDLEVTTKASTKGGVESIQVLLEGRFFIKGAGVTAHLWNWKGNKWDWIGREKMTTEDKTVMFRREKGATYVSGDGEIKVSFRIDSDWFSTFEFGADKVRFYVKTGNKKGAGSGGGKSGSGGSDDLGKKVADTWKKLLK